MKYDAIIIGGGITGLSAAYNLSKRGQKVILLEKENELGGLLSSYKFDGFYLEKYYHHVAAGDYYFLKLIDELSLSDQLICRFAPVGYLIGNCVHNLNTPLDILNFKNLSLNDKLRLALITLMAKYNKKPETLDNIPAKDWIINKGGARLFNNFFAPLLNAKFGENAENISAAWLVSRIKFRSNRSINGEKLIYLKDGFQVLIKRMREAVVRRGEIATGLKVEQIITNGQKVSGVKTAGQFFDSDVVISAVAPQILLSLCQFPKEFVEKLKRIPYQGIICGAFGIARNLTDTYWLNIGRNDLPFSLIAEHTNFYDKKEYGCHIIYVCSYIQSDLSNIWKKTDNDISASYLSALKDLFGLKEKEVLWQRVARDLYASPIYKTGYASLIPSVTASIKGLYSIGMMLCYPDRGINSSLLLGEKCANLVLKEFYYFFKNSSIFWLPIFVFEIISAASARVSG